MENTPEPKKLSAIEFAKEKLSLNPEATYAEIKAQARFEGIPIFPVVYGRAKALLGLVPTAPYGSKSKARKQAAERRIEKIEKIEKVEKVEPAPDARSANGSRPRADRVAAAIPAEAGGFEAMINDLRTAVKERDRYRTVLEKIASLIQSELDA